MNEIYKNELRKTSGLNNITERYLRNPTEKEQSAELKINYSEEAKTLFESCGQAETDTKAFKKPKVEKAIGKASQKRGKGRGCI